MLISKKYRKSIPYIVAGVLILALSCNFMYDNLLVESLNRVLPLTIISTMILSIPLKSVKEALYYSVIGVITLEVIYYTRLYKLGHDVIKHNEGIEYAIKRSKRKQRIWEGFEGEDKEDGDDDNDDNNGDSDDNEDKDTKIKDDDEAEKFGNDGDSEDTSKLLNEYVKSMSMMGNLSEDESGLLNDNDDDDDVLKKLYKDTKKGTKSMKDYTPMEAQLATYKMIDNVKELETLMQRLTPTLKMGHSLMKNFEKFGFNKK